MRQTDDSPISADDRVAAPEGTSERPPITDALPLAVRDETLPVSLAQLSLRAVTTTSPSVPGMAPPPESLRRVAGSAGRWKKQLGAAKEHWPKISIDDLIWSDGHVQRLAGLVQEFYRVDHDEAERLVIRFLAQSAG